MARIAALSFYNQPWAWMGNLGAREPFSRFRWLRSYRLRVWLGLLGRRLGLAHALCRRIGQRTPVRRHFDHISTVGCAGHAVDRQVAAVNAMPSRWEALPRAPADLKWLLDRVDEVAEHRNNAVHAPCTLYVGGGEDGGSEMGAAFFNGNSRARKLMGKRLLVEFDWCERYAENLSVFAQKLTTAITFSERYPWPNRPSKPTRKANPRARR
jgi:hypothetical protein